VKQAIPLAAQSYLSRDGKSLSQVGKKVLRRTGDLDRKVEGRTKNGGKKKWSNTSLPLPWRTESSKGGKCLSYGSPYPQDARVRPAVPALYADNTSKIQNRGSLRKASPLKAPRCGSKVKREKRTCRQRENRD